MRLNNAVVNKMSLLHQKLEGLQNEYEQLRRYFEHAIKPTQNNRNARSVFYDRYNRAHAFQQDCFKLEVDVRLFASANIGRNDEWRVTTVHQLRTWCVNLYISCRKHKLIPSLDDNVFDFLVDTLYQTFIFDSGSKLKYIAPTNSKTVRNTACAATTKGMVAARYVKYPIFFSLRRIDDAFHNHRHVLNPKLHKVYEWTKGITAKLNDAQTIGTLLAMLCNPLQHFETTDEFYVKLYKLFAKLLRLLEQTFQVTRYKGILPNPTYYGLLTPESIVKTMSVTSNYFNTEITSRAQQIGIARFIAGTLVDLALPSVNMRKAIDVVIRRCKESRLAEKDIVHLALLMDALVLQIGIKEALLVHKKTVRAALRAWDTRKLISFVSNIFVAVLQAKVTKPLATKITGKGSSNPLLYILATSTSQAAQKVKKHFSSLQLAYLIPGVMQQLDSKRNKHHRNVARGDLVAVHSHKLVGELNGTRSNNNVFYNARENFSNNDNNSGYHSNRSGTSNRSNRYNANRINTDQTK